MVPWEFVLIHLTTHTSKNCFLRKSLDMYFPYHDVDGAAATTILLLSWTPNNMVATLGLSGRSLSSCANEGNFYP